MAHAGLWQRSPGGARGEQAAQEGLAGGKYPRGITGELLTGGGEGG